jgi:hypothetical protein
MLQTIIDNSDVILSTLTGMNSAEKKELEDAIEKNRERDKIEEDIDRLSNDSVFNKLRNRWRRKDLL